MTEPLRFAIRGSGMIAQVHARALAELGDVAGLRVMVGRNASTTAALAARYGAVATGDLGAVLADVEIDVVIDCGPSGTRADLAVAALRAGKHVVLEKPMALTLGDAAPVRHHGGRREAPRPGRHPRHPRHVVHEGDVLIVSGQITDVETFAGRVERR
jgi:predicted dehydrogenase